MTEVLIFAAGFGVGSVLMWFRALRAIDGAFDEIEREQELR